MSLRLILVLLLLGCANIADAKGRLSRDEALGRAHMALADTQLNPKDYCVDNFVSRLSDDKRIWMFHFHLFHEPPDSGDFVDVDRETGVAKVRRDF